MVLWLRCWVIILLQRLNINLSQKTYMRPHAHVEHCIQAWNFIDVVEQIQCHVTKFFPEFSNNLPYEGRLRELYPCSLYCRRQFIEMFNIKNKTNKQKKENI